MSDGFDELGFHACIGEEACEALEEYVNPDWLTPNEAADPLYTIVGTDLTPTSLRTLSDETIGRIAERYNRNFEISTIDSTFIRNMVERILDRWG